MPTRFLCLTSVIALTAGGATAEMNFNRISSFATHHNMAAGEDTARETSPEIIDVTADGMTLVYTDSPLGALGLVDITDAKNPAPLGNIDLNGEPTSVAVVGNVAFAGVNTSESYTAPSGRLDAIDILSKTTTASCDLGGQPDSIASAKDGSFIAVAIENERDEDLNDGEIPQMPAGSLIMVNIENDTLACDTLKVVDLTGLAEVGGSDPEPEFVDINGLGETVVTLQENNHIAIVAADGTVVNHFSAGSVTLNNVDVADDDQLTFTATLTDVAREPDAVKWIDDTHFAIANEGDYQGGSRGWSIFNKDGTLVYDAGMSFENAVVTAGHFPDKRADNKGAEPESIGFGVYGDTPYVFVGSERGSIVGVYDVTDVANPVLKQLLPSGIAPEGFVPVPARGLMVSANEKDLVEDGGVRAHVMTFELQDAAATYPMLTSAGMDTLTGWGAISGMVAGENGMVYAVNDSFYAMQPTIFTIDTNVTPASIVAATPVTRGGVPAQKLDLEGITLDGKGGFWLASEGRTDRVIPHALYHVNADGEIEAEVGLPADLLAVEKRFGFEGITMVGDTLWMPVQREWNDDRKNHVKLVAYNTDSGDWGAVHYAKAEPKTGWVGLSEMTVHGDAAYIIERDNQIGEAAVTKKIYKVALSDLNPAPLGGDLPVVTKELAYDLIPDMLSTGGYVLDKVEGLSIDANGTAYVSTDNDGVDDHSGETMFFKVPLIGVGG